MKAGACDQCVLEMRWPLKLPNLLADLTSLLHRRPELADRGGWLGSRPTLAGVLVQSMLWGA